VAREALSARLDGERQHVPAARVDAHLGSCPDCRTWLAGAIELTRRTRAAGSAAPPDLSGQVMAAAGVEPAAGRAGRGRVFVSRALRCALAGVGLAQLGVAFAQISGVTFGMVAPGGHGAMTGMHLLNESTAWAFGLGCGMVVAGIWPKAAPGVATVLGVYVAVLAGYVISDAWGGQVTAARVASHAPVIVGLLLVLPVSRYRATARRSATARHRSDGDIVLPVGASRGRRRGQLRPVDHSAA
jgi:RNA polymerase sigma-70 factor, ECF subfamily